MAEICCQEAKSTPATVATVSASVAAAAVASSVMDRRRRRLEMKRFRLASDLEESAAEYARAGKRQRLARTASASCPDAGSVSQQDPDRCPRYGFSSVCGRRREMEDAVSVRPDFLTGSSKSHFFGVFDGHGCSHVATTCQDLMHEAVAEEHEKACSGEDVAWKEVMERSFARLDERAANWVTTRSSEEPACRCEQKMPSRCDHAGRNKSNESNMCTPKAEFSYPTANSTSPLAPPRGNGSSAWQKHMFILYIYLRRAPTRSLDTEKKQHPSVGAQTPHGLHNSARRSVFFSFPRPATTVSTLARSWRTTERLHTTYGPQAC